MHKSIVLNQLFENSYNFNVLTVIINYNHCLYINYIDLLYRAGGNAENFTFQIQTVLYLCVHKNGCLMLLLIARIDCEDFSYFNWVSLKIYYIYSYTFTVNNQKRKINRFCEFTVTSYPTVTA